MLKSFNKEKYDFIDRVNTLFFEAKSTYENSGYNSCVFGSNMLHLNDSDIVRTTIAHRFVNKFELPDDSRTTELKRDCFSAFQFYDASRRGKTVYSAMNSKTPGVRRSLFQARLLLREWVSEFKLSDEISITPGETFNSSEGKTSIYQKLKNKESWTVTADACEDFCKLVYRSPWLKKCAKKHFSSLERAEIKELYETFSRFKDIGRRIFIYRFMTEVLTVVHGSRASSVEKNNNARRFINIEPFGNVLLQRQVGLGLVDLMNKNVPGSSLTKVIGNDLINGQQDHQILIQNPTYATIDLQKASDSTWLDVVEFFLSGTRLYERLIRYRSPYILMNDDTYLRAFKLSSMGNGFTFEVMTIILLALCRTLDGASRVYGDDIIIKNRHAKHLIEMLDVCGYVINPTKSFVDSRFRESCGSFYLDSVGYVICYDFKWATNLVEAITLVNKLQLIFDAHPKEAQEVFGNLLVEVLRDVPALLVGPFTGDLSHQWVQVRNYERFARKNEVCRSVYKLMLNMSGEVLRDWQIGNSPHDRVSFIVVSSMEAHSATKILYDRNKNPVPRDVFQEAHWIYAGRPTKDTIRYDVFHKHDVYLVHQGMPIHKMGSLKDVLNLLASAAK